MKITTEPVNNTTNFDGEVFEAKLNTAKLSSVMQILIRNYNSPELATLREWVSNGHDSHIAAGIKKPVRVTLPSKFASNLVVEDFGIGMSYEDVRDVYATFLSSTKDENNEGIGGFGIGGKSALAIADQYSMVAIKDGLKNVFLFERSDNGGLAVKSVVRDAPTEDPTGVKVTVSTSKNWNFDKRQISAVLEGWTADEVELTNSEFDSFYSKSIEFPHGLVEKQVFDENAVNNNRGYGYGRLGSRVFVGPVSYPIPEQAARELMSSQKFSAFAQATNHQFAVKVGIGEVTFPSSREVIEPSEANIAVILKAFKKLYAEVEEHVNNRVATFKSIEEAYKFSTSHFVNSSNMTIVYEGRQLTKINYTGVKAFYIERSHQEDNVKLFEDKTLEYKSSAVDVVIRVSDEDAALSPETYRKYIRSAVTDHYLESRKTAQYHRGHYTILLTTDKDDLHPVTSKVFDFTELRKTPVAKSSSSSSPRITDAEALSRANRESGAADVKGTMKGVLFGDFYTEGTVPILLTKDDDAIATARLFGNVFGVQNRIFVAANKRSIITLKRAYPSSITLTEYLEEVPKAELDAAKARFKDLNKLLKVVELGRSGGTSLIQTMKNAKLLNDKADALFRDDLLVLVEDATRVFTRYRYGQKDQTESFKAAAVLIDVEKFKERQYVDRKGPFSLVNFRDYNNQEELAAYINWSADRHFATKA